MRPVVDVNGDQVQDYLSGQLFSSGLELQVPVLPVRGRIESLVEAARGRSVIHFGYCDHLPLVPQKMAADRWLHALLSNVATRCVGLDIDAEAVLELESKHQITNGFKFDLFADELPDLVRNASWDMLVMGEILEHVDNPVHFLEKIASVFRGHVRQLFVSVPNAYDLTAAEFAKRNSECVNSDHRYWFTPYTLRMVAFRAGFTRGTIYMCDESAGSQSKRARILKRNPIFAETLLGVFEMPM